MFMKHFLKQFVPKPYYWITGPLRCYKIIMGTFPLNSPKNVNKITQKALKNNNSIWMDPYPCVNLSRGFGACVTPSPSRDGFSTKYANNGSGLGIYTSIFVTRMFIQRTWATSCPSMECSSSCYQNRQIFSYLQKAIAQSLSISQSCWCSTNNMLKYIFLIYLSKCT